MMASAWDDDTAVSLAKGTLFKRAKLYIPSLGMPGGGDSLGIPANAPAQGGGAAVRQLPDPRPTCRRSSTPPSAAISRAPTSPGENALIPEEQRQKNGRPWLPGAYKGYFIEQFVSQVLQQ